MEVKFSNLPTGCGNDVPNGTLQFAIVQSTANTLIGNVAYASTLNYTYTLKSSVAGGTQFRTAFARYSTCTNVDQTFNGSLYY